MTDLLAVGTEVLVENYALWGYESPEARIINVDATDPDLTYRVQFEGNGVPTWVSRTDFTLVDEQATVGAKEIAFSEIQPGDTVRMVAESEWWGVKETTIFETTVDRIEDGVVLTSEDGRIFNDGTWYLLNRPEQDPEVQAIIDALDVSVDQAADFHSKGLRVVAP